MRRVTCRAARLWLQTPDDLSVASAHLLEQHVASCSACHDLQTWQREMDNCIQQSLEAAVGSRSVRSQVMTRLSARPLSPPSSHAPSAPPRNPRVHRMPRALLWPPVMAAVALVGLVLAVAGPQLVPGSERRVPTAGAAWHLVRPTIGYPLTVDPIHSDHLLAGAWGRVYESWNAGGSWSPLARLPAHAVIRALAIDRSEPNRYLVAVEHSVYLSTDRGRHWATAAAFVPGAMNMFLIQDAHVPGTFYLGPSILWKSVDHGRTWERAGRGTIFAPDGIQQLAITPDGALFTAIWNGGVAISTNGGRTWQRRAAGLAPKVMDVAAPSARTLWAGTMRGVFSSVDGGLHWRSASGIPRFPTTTVLVGSGYVLAGGNGALYRSADGGRLWQAAMAGLPLDPYVADLVADPHQPGRTFASLNSDGIFRSDDAGRHWTAVDAGLPLTGTEDSPHPVLFRRDGALWVTDSLGTDPGVLTVDRDVARAALSPDGATAAYVARNSSAWVVRVVSQGAGARTVASGTGPVPRLHWSPSSTLLAISQAEVVIVSDLQRRMYRWPFPADERLLGWAAGGRRLMFWNAQDGRVMLRSWDTGVPLAAVALSFPAEPLPAPDGRHLAFLQSGALQVGTWQGAVRPVALVAPDCHLTRWSDDSSRILLRCGSFIEERTIAGRTVTRARLPATTAWVPGSSADLLFFSDGALWRWTPPSHATIIVRGADPAQP